MVANADPFSDAYKNQNYQFEELVEKIEVKRDMSRHPMFDIVFAFQNIDMKEIKLNGLNVNLYNSENRITKFDIYVI